VIGCENARRLLAGRLDGDLGPAEVRDLETHLNGCSDCREIASGLEVVASGLLRLPAETLPDDDFERVLARTVGKAAFASRRAATRRSFFLAAAAAVLAAAVLIPFALRESTPAEPTAAEIDRATRDARMVLAMASHALRSGETAARERVIGREVSPALRRVPVRWSHVSGPRRNGV
jgi:predicted anti-sigma-YlaC factor YlaD